MIAAAGGVVFTLMKSNESVIYLRGPINNKCIIFLRTYSTHSSIVLNISEKNVQIETLH